jgi:ribonucleoside-diphosphate reductase alpha chain
MPVERRSLTHKFCIAGHEGYLTAGLYDDGTVGELFISDVGKEGSTLRGVFSAWATTLSIALQHGVPLESLVRKFAYMRFEPRGATDNPEIPRGTGSRLRRALAGVPPFSTSTRGTSSAC